MSALRQVLETIELVDHILQYLPLATFLRSRRVCRSWKELISTSKRLRRIRSEPYIGVSIRLPSLCSASQDDPAVLEADLVLYYDQPITVFKSAGGVPFPATTFMKFAEGEQPPISNDSRGRIWGNKYLSRPCHFRPDTVDRWRTLYPGRPYCLSWTYRDYNPRAMPRTLEILSADVGKIFILTLRPDLYAGHLVGTKQCLLARKESGEDLESCTLEHGLPLMAENQVRYKATP